MLAVYYGNADLTAVEIQIVTLFFFLSGDSTWSSLHCSSVLYSYLL